ncbi:MAG: hypothetical protein IJB65_08015 [Clostridia bacterium]|nr:hypothetical protein [Clostridia bacterium]
MNKKRLQTVCALLLLLANVLLASCAAEKENAVSNGTASAENSSFDASESIEDISESLVQDNSESGGEEVIPHSEIKGVEYLNSTCKSVAYYNANHKYCIPDDLVPGMSIQKIDYENSEKTLDTSLLSQATVAGLTEYKKSEDDTPIGYEVLEEDVPIYLCLRVLINHDDDDTMSDKYAEIKNTLESLGIYTQAQIDVIAHLNGADWTSELSFLYYDNNLPDNYLETRATKELLYENRYGKVPIVFYVVYATKEQITALKSYCENEGSLLFSAKAYPMPCISVEDIAYPDIVRVAE